MKDQKETLREFALKYGTSAFVEAVDRSYAWQTSETVREHLQAAVARSLGIDPAATRLPRGYRQVLAPELTESLDGYRRLQHAKALVEAADVPELPTVLLEEVAFVRPAIEGEKGDEDDEVPAGYLVRLQVTIGGVTASVYMQ